MKNKLILGIGFAVGYVLGARAGRNRYHQIRKVAERVCDTPLVQYGKQQVTDFAQERYEQVREVVGKKIGEAIAAPKKTGKQDTTAK